MTIPAATGDAGELFWFKGTLVNIRVSAKAGADGISVVEHMMPYGESPPLHIHRNEDELFHVLEGTMRFHVGGKDTVAHAGQILLAPKGVPHTFRVESAVGARCLTITTGGDFENMVREMGAPAQFGDMPPAGEPTPEMIAALTEACARNGIDIIGPPLD